MEFVNKWHARQLDALFLKAQNHVLKIVKMKNQVCALKNTNPFAEQLMCNVYALHVIPSMKPFRIAALQSSLEHEIFVKEPANSLKTRKQAVNILKQDLKNAL